MFSFGEASMGGVRMRKKLVMQSYISIKPRGIHSELTIDLLLETLIYVTNRAYLVWCLSKFSAYPICLYNHWWESAYRLIPCTVH